VKLRNAAVVLALAVLPPSRALVNTQSLATAAARSFDAVSIKRNTRSLMSSPGAAEVGFYPDRFVMRDGATVVIIRSAYPDAVDILGLPEWAFSKGRYDVEAKAGVKATTAEMETMLRDMLANRFMLRAHDEKRPQQTYALKIARDDGRLGPRIKPYAGDCSAYSNAQRAGREAPVMPTPTNGARACGYMMSDRLLSAGGITMERLAGSLRGHAGRIVVDKTGLTGLYEFTLETDADVTVFTALREQLGLKLEPETVPMPVLVVDHIEQPVEN
jgi:uncharacterized protein (TIGR03435 family)